MGSHLSDPEIVRLIRETQHDLAVAKLLNSPTQKLIQDSYERWKDEARRRNIKLPEENSRERRSHSRQND